jgi:spore coat protein U-like protein
VSVALRVCVNLGAGSGGATNAANRFMKSGANALTYGLFSNAARTTPWGSNFWAAGGASAVIVDFPTFIGTSTQTRTLYGRVYSGQQTVPAGSYLSSFSSTDAEIQYGLLSLGSCNLLTNTNTTSFNVTATVPTTCTVAANNLNFGTAGTLSANTDASTTLQPACTSGTPYNIGLNGGLSGATDPTQRKMTKAAEFVLYGLYRNSARSLPFGNTIGTNTLAGTGTGLAQSVTVYGRIPPQAAPSPGTYNDTIVVTLTY